MICLPCTTFVANSPLIATRGCRRAPLVLLTPQAINGSNCFNGAATHPESFISRAGRHNGSNVAQIQIPNSTSGRDDIGEIPMSVKILLLLALMLPILLIAGGVAYRRRDEVN